MLRDGFSLDRHNDDNLFMNTAGAATQESQSNQADALDDVFGSAPASPVLTEAAHLENHPVTHRPRDHSDIPRLRSLHITNGYREGIAASKERHIQEGFDEGFSLGAEIGMKAGWCLGALEGMLAVVGADLKQHLSAMLRAAEDELQVKKLFGEDYFGPDGIWLYNVPGQDTAEDQVTFANVATHHPLLRKWTQQVEDTSASLSLKLDFQ